jgi:hypothetical protein
MPKRTIMNMSIGEILSATADAVRELISELPAAFARGPEAVAETLMNDRRRPFIGVALASLALLLMVLSA